jgi:hypothetical protein
MAKMNLVVGKADFQDTVSSLFGVLDCESQLKTSRIATTAKQKSDELARSIRKESKKEIALREKREARDELIRATNAQAAIEQANRMPSKCRKLLRQARKFLPATHKIILEASPIGILRKLVRSNQTVPASA